MWFLKVLLTLDIIVAVAFIALFITFLCKVIYLFYDKHPGFKSADCPGKKKLLWPDKVIMAVKILFVAFCPVINVLGCYVVVSDFDVLYDNVLHSTEEVFGLISQEVTGHD